jgi:hypothetical protein
VLTAVTTFAADNVRDLDGIYQIWGSVGLALLGVAIILYLITMFFYDSLLMPRRFWHGDRPKSSRRRPANPTPKRKNQLARPPSSGTVVLYQNMVLVWSRVFVPATFVAGFGLACYVYGAAQLESWAGRTGFVAGAISIAILTVAIGLWGRPRLGVSD